MISNFMALVGRARGARSSLINIAHGYGSDLNPCQLERQRAARDLPIACRRHSIGPRVLLVNYDAYSPLTQLLFLLIPGQRAAPDCLFGFHLALTGATRSIQQVADRDPDAAVARSTLELLAPSVGRSPLQNLHLSSSPLLLASRESRVAIAADN